MSDVVLERALAGDRKALDELIGSVRDRVYNLALRMLWHPEDAQDATQEILIRVVTHLSSFERQCAFSTWVYRIACNTLLSTRKRRAEQPEVTFEAFAAGLATPSEPAWSLAPQERSLLVEEVKVGCTHAMLLALDREHRVVFILAEIMALGSDVGAQVLSIEPATFRKRLSRARERLGGFLKRHCGLADPAVTCRCDGRIGAAKARGHVDPNHLLFAGKPRSELPATTVARATSELDGFEVAGEVLRENPAYATPEALVSGIRELLDATTFQVRK
ncbi:MAG: RNA polymerase sigma factor [Polyangiaceae bacterium]